MPKNTRSAHHCSARWRQFASSSRRAAYAATASSKNGPPFCRSGQGHPVHGRQWCVDKGWGLGGRDVRLDRRRDDDDVVIRRIPRDRDDRGDGSVLDRLGDIIRGRTR